ncbi:protocadherin beta-16-like protein [Labeo rohita]|uniref:Protocadherin beta-16-like protein n=1 Tax=Labeo rohita TaxID=84645 RepID=A0A498NA80_LABRO|nr:protocadherin beta-16-like protein [Labeo rohita]
MVPKSAPSHSLVSKVIAVDADSGQNAWLSYHIIKATDPGLFTIGVHSGEIRTQRDISESDNMKQNLIVSVRDNGQPSLSATCALFLLISDNLAEVPELKDMSRDESSSKLTFYLIIALVSVSTFFLTFIIIILAVKFCRRRKPRLLFDGAVAIPSAYLPPNYAEVEGAGTLRSTYNYDAYLTTGSRTSDFKFVRSYNEGTLTADLTLKKTHSADDLNDFAEGIENVSQARSLVSKVIAVDADSGQNAWLSYHIIKATDPGLFAIGVHSGEIRTQRDISESDSMKQNLIVSVRDNGQPSLSATCALYFLVSDNLAEVPELKDMSRDESSSKLTFYLIIALVSVSTFFLTFIIIILAVRFCRRRKPRLLFDGAVAIPSAYLPPNYAEVEGAGTLRSTYNYDAYLTTGSRTSDFKFVRSYNEGTLTADLTLKKTQSAVDDLEGLDAELSDSFQMKRGSVIGNIAKDLGLDVNRLSFRKARIDTESNRKRYCDINLNTGELTVAERIDREGLCGKKASCVLIQELVLENPLELHRISLLVQDVNDNSPYFGKDEINLEIRESADKGKRFLFEANDADIGQNSVQSYAIQSNGYFLLSVQSNSFGEKYAEMILNKEFDREHEQDVTLILTAVDGGTPPRSDNLAEVPELKDMSRDESSSKLTFYLIIALVSVSTFFLTFIIIILAVKFCRRRKPRLLFDGAVAIPSAYLPPNYAEVEGAGTLRSTYNYDAYLTTGSRTSDFKFIRSYNEGTLTADLTLKKTALDDLEGLDAEAMHDSTSEKKLLLENPLKVYSLLLDIQDINDNSPAFDNETGEMFTLHPFDYETSTHFHVRVMARDEGRPSFTSTCTVQIFIADQNDNAPVVLYPVQFDGYLAHDIVPRAAPAGYLVTKVIAVDADAGHNAWLSYRIVKATKSNLFTIGLHCGEIRTLRLFAEDDEIKQTLIVSVSDNGLESLSTTATLNIMIEDGLPIIDELFARGTDESHGNSDLTLYLIMALAGMSSLFLVLIIAVVYMRLCRYRYIYRSTANLPVFPPTYGPPGYSDVSRFNTLQKDDRYNSFLTTGSWKGDFRFGSDFVDLDMLNKRGTSLHVSGCSVTRAKLLVPHKL